MSRRTGLTWREWEGVRDRVRVMARRQSTVTLFALQKGLSDAVGGTLLDEGVALEALQWVPASFVVLDPQGRELGRGRQAD